MEKYFNSISKITAVLGGGIVYLLGGWDNFIIALLVLMGIDYFTGFLKGLYSKELSSKTGMQGIIKKVYIICIVSMAVMCERIGVPAVREVTIVFFVVNEALSILENASQLGLPIPETLKSTLLQLRETKKESEQE